MIGPVSIDYGVRKLGVSVEYYLISKAAEIPDGLRRDVLQLIPCKLIKPEARIFFSEGKNCTPLGEFILLYRIIEW